jgi:hypothetical protein
MTSRHKSKIKLAKPVRRPAARKPPDARKTMEAEIQNVEIADQPLQSGASSMGEVTENPGQHQQDMDISEDEPQQSGPASVIDARTAKTDFFREWLDFARDRQEKNLAGFKTLMQCRTPQDFVSYQCASMRDCVEGLLSYGRRLSGH